MISQDVAMGTAMAVMCGIGLWYVDGILTKSRNCQRLAELWGRERARWAISLLLAGGVLTGLMLAFGVIHPWHAK